MLNRSAQTKRHQKEGNKLNKLFIGAPQPCLRTVCDSENRESRKELQGRCNRGKPWSRRSIKVNFRHARWRVNSKRHVTRNSRHRHVTRNNQSIRAKLYNAVTWSRLFAPKLLCYVNSARFPMCYKQKQRKTTNESSIIIRSNCIVFHAKNKKFQLLFLLMKSTIKLG